MSVDEFVRRFPFDATEEEVAAARYLERAGRRFMIDFGFRNAPAIVWAELDGECEVVQ